METTREDLQLFYDTITNAISHSNAYKCWELGNFGEDILYALKENNITETKEIQNVLLGTVVVLSSQIVKQNK